MHVMKQIFDRQLELQRQYAEVQALKGKPGEDANTDADQALEMLKCAAEECFEAQICFPHRKRWANVLPFQSLASAKRQGLLEEIADIFLFVIAALQWAGFSYVEFIAICEKKQAKNTERLAKLRESQKAKLDGAERNRVMQAKWAYSDLPRLKRMFTNEEAFINAYRDSR